MHQSNGNFLIALVLIAGFSQLYAITLTASTKTKTSTKMINIGYLTTTYDLYYGNPNPSNGLDPGFRAYPIFNFQYTKNTVTPDGLYLVPDNVNVIGEQICNLDFASTSITGTQSYTNSLQASVSVNGGYGPASFSASADYKSVQSGTSSQSSIYISNQGVCSVYNTNINPASYPTVDPTFLKEVQALPATYSSTTKAAYMSFLQKHGTHYFAQMRMGAKYGYLSQLSQTAWSTMNVQGITVSAAASYSAMASVGVKAMTSSQKEQAATFDSMKSNVKQITIGSAPPADGNILTWANNCYGNPMPISYTLESIASLFVAGLFPSLSNIATIQANIKSALNEYCAYLVSIKAIASCANPPADPALPVVPNACRLCNGGCGNSFTADGGVISLDQNLRDWFYQFDSTCSGIANDWTDITYNKGVHLCCQPQSSSNVGSCKFCNSCGGTYSYDNGAVMNNNWGDANWVNAYDNQCTGSPRVRTNPTGIHLCCANADICSFCLTCGGNYPEETAMMGNKNAWDNFFLARGKNCAGSPASITGIGAPGWGIALCCKTSGVPT